MPRAYKSFFSEYEEVPQIDEGSSDGSFDSRRFSKRPSSYIYRCLCIIFLCLFVTPPLYRISLWFRPSKPHSADLKSFGYDNAIEIVRELESWRSETGEPALEQVEELKSLMKSQKEKYEQELEDLTSQIRSLTKVVAEGSDSSSPSTDSLPKVPVSSKEMDDLSPSTTSTTTRAPVKKSHSGKSRKIKMCPSTSDAGTCRSSRCAWTGEKCSGSCLHYEDFRIVGEHLELWTNITAEECEHACLNYKDCAAFWHWEEQCQSFKTFKMKGVKRDVLTVVCTEGDGIKKNPEGLNPELSVKKSSITIEHVQSTSAPLLPFQAEAFCAAFDHPSFCLHEQCAWLDQACVPRCRRLENLKVDGERMKRINDVDYDTCERTCVDDPNCAGFWIWQETCILHGTISQILRSKGVVSALCAEEPETDVPLTEDYQSKSNGFAPHIQHWQDRVKSEKPLKELKFIHISKNGGSWIEEVGRQAGIDWGKYHKAEYGFWHGIFRDKPETLKKKYDWFTIVRNPYDRIISEFHCQQSELANKTDEEMAEWTKERFNQFVRKKMWDHSDWPGMMGNHYSEQFKYIDTNQTIHVIKFENLKQEFEVLLKRYGLTNVLKEINRERENAAPKKWFHREDFDPRNIRQIKETYANDFKWFGYNLI